MSQAYHEQPDVRQVALRPVNEKSRGLTITTIFLATLVIAALGLWVYQLIFGMVVTNLSDRVFWGVYTANLVAFIGLSYGGALTSAILRLTNATWRAPITRLAEATALITLVIGTIFVFIHLGRPERVWQFFTSPNLSSPLIWDAVAIFTYMIATIIFLYLPLIPDLAIASQSSELTSWKRRLYVFLSLGWRGTDEEHHSLNRAMTMMAILIIPIAVTVHSVLSWAFAVTTREGWHSTIFGPYFVIAALYSGVALVIITVLLFRKLYSLEEFINEEHIKNLSYIMITLGILYLYFTFSELLTVGYPLTEKAELFFYTLLIGTYAIYFWIFIILGGILPILIVAIRKTRNIVGIGIAATFVINALWLKRLLIVVPAQSTPQIGGELVLYWPSALEMIITIGGMAAIPLGLIIFFKIFPILSITEIEDLRETATDGQQSQ